MKKIVVLTLFLILCFSYLSFANEFANYEHPHFGFSLKYPRTWYVQGGLHNTALVALAPLENERDQYQENLNITIENLRGLEISLADYYDRALSQLEKYILDYKLIKASSTLVAGQEGKIIYFQGTQAGIKLNWLQIFFLYNNQAYIITFSLEPTKLEVYLPEIIGILGSFELH